METIRSERKLCVCCMEEHEVAIVLVKNMTTFKGEQVEYLAVHEYCDRADELVTRENMITKNNASMKKAYHKKVGSSQCRRATTFGLQVAPENDI